MFIYWLIHIYIDIYILNIKCALILSNDFKSPFVPCRFLWWSNTTSKSSCRVWSAGTGWRKSAATRCWKSLSQGSWGETMSSFARPKYLRITWRGPATERTRGWIWAVRLDITYEQLEFKRKPIRSQEFLPVRFQSFFFIWFILGVCKPLAEMFPGFNRKHWQVLEARATLTTRNTSPGSSWQDLSKSPGSAVHSRWHSPAQGGIATSAEHMLFVETPESVSSFPFFSTPPPAPRSLPPSISCFPSRTSVQAISVWLIKFTWELQSPSLHWAAIRHVPFPRGRF